MQDFVLNSLFLCVEVKCVHMCVHFFFLMSNERLLSFINCHGTWRSMVFVLFWIVYYSVPMRERGREGLIYTHVDVIILIILFGIALLTIVAVIYVAVVLMTKKVITIKLLSQLLCARESIKWWMLNYAWWYLKLQKLQTKFYNYRRYFNLNVRIWMLMAKNIKFTWFVFINLKM